MNQYDPIAMRNFVVYHCQWYIRQYEECNQYPIMECRFGPKIRTNKQDGTLGNMLPVTSSKVQNLPQKNNIYMWYQYDISMDEHRLFGQFQLGTTGRKKLK